MASVKFKTTYILIAIFAILFLFVYFYEKDREIMDENEIETYKVAEINIEEVKQIKFIQDEKNTVVKKEGNKWNITKPIKYQARTSKIEDVIKEINNMEASQKFSADNLSEFGLDSVANKVIITTSNDEKLEMLFGDPNPDQSKIYLKASSSDEIFLVDAQVENSLSLDEEVLKED